MVMVHMRGGVVVDVLAAAEPLVVAVHIATTFF
jgi:hypothetical protein